VAAPQRKFDPYHVLRLERDAGAEDVKRAFRDRAKATHPDAGGSAEAFADVKRAHVILSDPKKRAKFDSTGEAEPDAVDNADQRAMQIIAMLLRGALAGEQDPLRADVVTAIRQAIDKDVADLHQRIRVIERVIKRAERMRGRFRKARRKGKPDGQNLLDSMLTWEIREAEAGLANMKAALADRKRAHEILADYSFDREEDMAALQRQMAANAYAAASSSTSPFGFRIF